MMWMDCMSPTGRHHRKEHPETIITLLSLNLSNENKKSPTSWRKWWETIATHWLWLWLSHYVMMLQTEGVQVEESLLRSFELELSNFHAISCDKVARHFSSRYPPPARPSCMSQYRNCWYAIHVVLVFLTVFKMLLLIFCSTKKVSTSCRSLMCVHWP